MPSACAVTRYGSADAQAGRGELAARWSWSCWSCRDGTCTIVTLAPAIGWPSSPTTKPESWLEVSCATASGAAKHGGESRAQGDGRRGKNRRYGGGEADRATAIGHGSIGSRNVTVSIGAGPGDVTASAARIATFGSSPPSPRSSIVGALRVAADDRCRHAPRHRRPRGPRVRARAAPDRHRHLHRAPMRQVPDRMIDRVRAPAHARDERVVALAARRTAPRRDAARAARLP